MKDKYYEQAVTCVKDTVLPAQIKLYESCGGDLDTIYGEAMNGNGFFGKVIEAGHMLAWHQLLSFKRGVEASHWNDLFVCM